MRAMVLAAAAAAVETGRPPQDLSHSRRGLRRSLLMQRRGDGSGDGDGRFRGFKGYGGGADPPGMSRGPLSEGPWPVGPWPVHRPPVLPSAIVTVKMRSGFDDTVLLRENLLAVQVGGGSEASILVDVSLLVYMPM